MRLTLKQVQEFQPVLVHRSRGGSGEGEAKGFGPDAVFQIAQSEEAARHLGAANNLVTVLPLHGVTEIHNF